MKELIQTFKIMLNNIDSPTELTEFCRIALMQAQQLEHNDSFTIEDNNILNYYIY
jgi:hypothetical protein